MHISHCHYIGCAKWVPKHNCAATTAGHSSTAWVHHDWFGMGRQRHTSKSWTISLASPLCWSTRGRGWVCAIFLCQQICSQSSTIKEATRWRDQSHCHVELQSLECRDAIPYIQQGTPSDSWCCGELAPLPPFRQKFHGPYGPCLLMAHTNTTLTHSTTNGELSNFTTSYIEHPIQPRCKIPGIWHTYKTASL